MRGSEERTGPVRRTSDADDHRPGWLDRAQTDHVARFWRPDSIRRARSRRRLHRSRQHLSARSRQGGPGSGHRHRRRYAGGAREQLAPFAVQPGGRTPQRCDAVVEYLSVSRLRQNASELHLRGEEDALNSLRERNDTKSL